VGLRELLIFSYLIILCFVSRVKCRNSFAGDCKRYFNKKAFNRIGFS
jgi:hypothetical protein